MIVSFSFKFKKKIFQPKIVLNLNVVNTDL